ncbi:MAG: hypothetical protein MSA74_01340, partial [Ruminococcus sp.]|nr:hypothetical protein [Ruminococcus sp.]
LQECKSQDRICVHFSLDFYILVDIMTKAVVGELCQISAFTQFKIKTRSNRKSCSAISEIPPAVKQQRFYAAAAIVHFPSKSLLEMCQVLLTISFIILIFPEKSYKPSKIDL